MSIGPSTTQSPYLISLNPNVRFTSILSAGDAVGTKPTLDIEGYPSGQPWVFAGIPDGLGAYDNNDGTITVLVNHEIFPPNAAVIREHGAPGAFVSQLVIDKTTLEVVDAFDAANASYRDADGDGVWTLEATIMNRLCSADLPPVSAFFWAGEDGIEGTADDVGTQDRIFMNGEEFGAEGRAFGWVVTGDEARTVWELPYLGKFSWENSVASPDSEAKTVVIGLDDATPGQVYVYVGDKQADGNTIEKAGLSGGKLFGIKADGIGNGLTAENVVGTVPGSGAFSLVEIENQNTLTGAQQDAASDALGVTEFARPEDGAWDTQNPNRFYFVTTGSGLAPNRLWALDFVDVENPELGGTFTLLLDGTEGTVALDNIGVDADGKVWMQEDPGTNPRSARTWVYDPATDEVDLIAIHDPLRFGESIPGAGNIAATLPFTINEEASGIIDVTDLLGDEDTQAFLVDVQAHYTFTGPLQSEVVEGGQLLVMYVDEFVSNPEGDRFDNTLVSGFESEEMIGKLGNDVLFGYVGNDSIRGGDGNDTIVGGEGADLLNGNNGADWFVYNNGVEGADTIRRFQVGQDKIVVSASGFGGGLVEGVLDSEKLAFGTEAELLGSGQFVFDDATGRLSWDADGQNGVQSITLATVLFQPSNPFLFTAADILVIA